MRKYVLLIVALLLPFMSVGATEQRVFDEANLLTVEEIAVLEERIATLQKDTKSDIIIVTIDEAEGLSAFDFSDKFFDEYGFGVGRDRTGIQLLIDMDNRELYVMTDGHWIDLLTDLRQESLLDALFEWATEDDFFAVAQQFLLGVESFYEAGVVEGQHRYDEETGRITPYQPPLTWQAVTVMLIISLGIGGAFYAIVLVRYRAGSGKYVFASRQNSHLNLTERRDHFINRTMTKTRIPQHQPSGNQSSSGSSSNRSTTRTGSSSGRSRGGGGRKF